MILTYIKSHVLSIILQNKAAPQNIQQEQSVSEKIFLKETQTVICKIKGKRSVTTLKAKNKYISDFFVLLFSDLFFKYAQLMPSLPIS